MAASSRADRCIGAVCATLLALAAGADAATLQQREEAITYSYDEAEIDLGKDLHILSGNVRVAQGPMSLTADRAVIRDPQSDRSHWTFEENVHIQTPEVDLRSEAANAVVVNGELADARVTGAPAEFEQRGGEPDRPVRGRASAIEYDLTKGVLTLTGEVWFSFGENEFRGDTVVYNLRSERVQVNPGGRSPSRVNITIRPGSLNGAGDSRRDTQGEPGGEQSGDGA